MGIHVHVKGQPDRCGCCATKEKLDTLWDRASGAVLTINGVYPDAMGAITVDLLQEAAVQSLIEDYINPMQDNLDAMNTRLDGYTDIFDNYGAILQAVNVTIPGEIDDVQDYAEAIADDLLQNYLTKQAIISGYATKAEIQGLATRQDIQNVINGYIAKQGTATPQVISGSGGLQIAGDLAVGGDITASGDTFVHWDNIAGAEIGPIIISGNSINIPGYVTLNTPQTITESKIFTRGFTLQRQIPAIDFIANTNYTQGVITFERVNASKTTLVSLNPDGIRNELPIPSGANSKRFVDKAFVESTDGVTNNIMHTIASEQVYGDKHFHNYVKLKSSNDLSVTPVVGAIEGNRLYFEDVNGKNIGFMTLIKEAGHTPYIQFLVVRDDGTFKYINVGRDQQ